MVDLLDDDAISAGLVGLMWERRGDEIVRTIKRQGFAGALAFVNAVGRIAEQRDHHPDIIIRWDTVTLELSTHDSGGLTQLDLDLAAAIDALG